MSVETSSSHTLKITCPRDELAQAFSSLAGPCPPDRRSDPRRRSSSARRRTARARRYGHGDVAAGVAAGVVVEKPGGRRSRAAAGRDRSASPSRRSDARASRPESGADHSRAGAASYRLNTYAADDFPRLPVDRASGIFGARPPGVSRDRGESQPRRLAGRVPAGADGHARSLRRHSRRHGRHELLPPEREGDPLSERRGSRARGDRPGARACRGRARCPGESGRARSTSGCRRTRSSSDSTA